MANNDTIDELIKTPKSVTSDAGTVTFVSVSDAIKLDKYKQQKQAKKGAKRCLFSASKHKEF